MLRSFLQAMFRGCRRRSSRPCRLPLRFAPGFESLETRFAPAVTAFFSPGAGLLSVLGDSLDNTITVSRNAAGILLVNGGAVQVLGGTPTVANTAQISVFGLGGSDRLELNEASGALPLAMMQGGEGNDTLIGGSGADQLFGQSGNDNLQGRGGIDLLFGGEDNDALTGGDGNDQVFGQAGDDRMISNSGDDSDLMEGGDGVDTVEVDGGGVAEVFTVSVNGTRVRFARTTPDPFTLDIGTTEHLDLDANNGNDAFSASGNLAALIQLNVNGGEGNDTLLGSNGADVLAGGEDNDFVDGNQGNDQVFLGSGNDTYQFDPGDGNDVVEGQSGTDTLRFNGSNGPEIFAASANGQRVRFTSSLGNIVTDLNDVERIDLNALGGTDTVTINDLSGTDVVAVTIDLAGTLGGTVGDNLADSVILNGTNAANAVQVTASGTSYTVAGLPAFVTVRNSQAANDQLVVNLLAGNDTFSATGNLVALAKLTVDGGIGNDTLNGSNGVDELLGGEGNDVVDGNAGNDLVFLGAGDDTAVFNPGDGSDTIEGQAGFDKLVFNGANVNEEITISAAPGGRVTFFRNIAIVTMDLNDVEGIDFNALGGADKITVNDLSGTDVVEINLNLTEAANLAGADTVIVQGTSGDDVILAVGDASGTSVLGLAAQVNITGAQSANDRLTINALAGDDVVEASGLAAGAIRLTADGGGDDDILVGGDGNDVLSGGAGDDVLIGGPGLDSLDGGPGDNVVIQG